MLSGFVVFVHRSIIVFFQFIVNLGYRYNLSVVIFILLDQIDWTYLIVFPSTLEGFPCNSWCSLLGLAPFNPILWCYVWYYVWYYVWHYVWLNVVINKVVLLLSKIMVTWIFGHYHIIHEMHSMWFNHRKYKSQVLCKLRILIHSP